VLQPEIYSDLAGGGVDFGDACRARVEEADRLIDRFSDLAIGRIEIVWTLPDLLDLRLQVAHTGRLSGDRLQPGIVCDRQS
jgi:hypothetical protein